MGKFHTLSGVVYMVGWFIFLDGALWSKEKVGSPYSFVDTLPGIFCTMGLILFALCNIKMISNGSNDEEGWGMMGGGGGAFGEEDQGAPMKARIIFFIASIFMLAGMTVAIWQMAANGTKKDNPWTGWALLLQVFIHMLSALFLGIGQVKSGKRD